MGAWSAGALGRSSNPHWDAFRPLAIGQRRLSVDVPEFHATAFAYLL